MNLEIIRNMNLRPRTAREEAEFKTNESKIQKWVREVKIQDKQGNNKNNALIGSGNRRLYKNEDLVSLLGGLIH